MSETTKITAARFLIVRSLCDNTIHLVECSMDAYPNIGDIVFFDGSTPNEPGIITFEFTAFDHLAETRRALEALWGGSCSTATSIYRKRWEEKF